MMASSLLEHVTGRPATPVEAMAETRSVNEHQHLICQGNTEESRYGNWERKLTGQRRNTIHKDPETRQSPRGLENTIEREREREH